MLLTAYLRFGTYDFLIPLLFLTGAFDLPTCCLLLVLATTLSLF
jgi:hypothetical protein